ncbi:serine/threonine-protein phosphatase 7 [Hordeum vulgare]|nr:serine/threonine-protein phosphatase 7 [Hordeum vulgare]
MEALIGMSPPQPEVEDGGKKDRVPTGAPFTWIAANFAHCHEDANDDVIQTYARMYMWYVISGTIFADGTSKNAQWMWLKALTVFDNKFSRGSAALAYLYRQLDEACRKCTRDNGIGSCMLLLSVWSWEHLLVGRPREATFKTWDDHDNHVRLPTWAYKWGVVSEVTSDVNLLYKQYTNEMDSLTAEQVEWQPYGVGPSFGDAHTFQLNPICLQERDLWLICCPLICNWVVEFLLPHCVLHKFGLFQQRPSEWVYTDAQLYRLDRRRQRKIMDWNKHHKKYATMFEQSVEAAMSTQGAQACEHCPLAFNNYVRRFQENSRVEICSPAYEEDVLEDPTSFDALAHGEYNRLIREGYQTSFAPVLNFVKQGQKLRRLSNILGCRDPEYSEPSRSGSSHRNTLDDSNTSEAHMDDGDITSAAHLEDDVFSLEVRDEMTLKAFQCSAYMLKPRRGFKRFTPEDYANKGKNPVAEGSRMTVDVTRMRGMDDDDDDVDELDELQPVVRKNLPSKRGRGHKT